MGREAHRLIKMMRARPFKVPAPTGVQRRSWREQPCCAWGQPCPPTTHHTARPLLPACTYAPAYRRGVMALLLTLPHQVSLPNARTSASHVHNTQGHYANCWRVRGKGAGICGESRNAVGRGLGQHVAKQGTADIPSKSCHQITLQIMFQEQPYHPTHRSPYA